MSHDRDRSIEALLRQREGPVSPLTDQCVDAESIAAWMEGGQSAESRAVVEAHVSGCARCQAVLASMARTAPDGESILWWRSVTAKWLVPVAAIATALLVWTAVGRGPVQSTTPQPSSVDASRAASPPATSPAAPPNAPLSAPVQSRPAPADAFANKTAKQSGQESDVEARSRQESATMDRLQDRRRDAVAEPTRSAASLPVAGGIAGGKVDASRPQGQAAAETPARSTPPPPPGGPPPPVAGLPAAAAPAPAPVVAAEAKPGAVGGVAESVSISREAAAKEFGAGGGRAGLAAAALEIRSPDLNYRWRILPPAGVQRSTDGGMTWSIVDPLPASTRQGSATTTVFTAGSAPARTICWIVGRAGVVLLSTDGATWQRRPFPETVDLNVVRASDASTAVVTAVDGRQFATTDGGATWARPK